VRENDAALIVRATQHVAVIDAQERLVTHRSHILAARDEPTNDVGWMFSSVSKRPRARRR
jgi:hypothetical protein